MVGVMDPKTGQILAMATYPNFDPGIIRIIRKMFTETLLFRILTNPVLLLSLWLCLRPWTRNSLPPKLKCTICSGPVSVGGYDLHTWDDKYFKDTTMTEVIQHSDNTGMIFVAQKLGVGGMINYLGKFGIGDATGIDLQGEVAPSLKAGKSMVCG
jgi:stage V sporulation protein D (sporulation-specific penicillin-binding protein)